MWNRIKKVNFVNKDIFNKSYYTKLKFGISSAYLSQCVATLHCFLSSKSLNNNSESCSQLRSWKSKIQFTKNTRMGIKSEKTEKNWGNWVILLMKRVWINSSLNLLCSDKQGNLLQNLTKSAISSIPSF